MIKIHANSITYEITQDTEVIRGRAARDGESPYERALRVRMGEAGYDNAEVVIRWDDPAEMPKVAVSRAFGRGFWPQIEIGTAEDGSRDGVTIRVDIAGSTAPITVTRLRRK